MTNGAGLATSPIVSPALQDGEAGCGAYLPVRVSPAPQVRCRNACRAGRSWHRGVLRFVSPVALDAAGWSQRDAPPSAAVAHLSMPLAEHGRAWGLQPANGRTDCLPSSGRGAGPVRRGLG